MVDPKHAFALTFTAISLTGCAAPGALQLGLLAGGAASYLTTGKGLSDHAMSAALDEDCAVHRIVVGNQICHAYPPPEEAVAVVDGPDPSQAAKMAASLSADHATEPSSEMPATVAPKIFLVIGSFRNADNAERCRARHEAFNSTVLTTEIDGERRYRVVAGPFKDKNVGLARSLLAAAGVTDSWPLQDTLASAAANHPS
ncbi:MAG: SPOR domain-containing protein [Gammaproteobacteria bacterium]|nr:SPOR domain-containing protein [Gammaproteobacteria bacterium]